MRKSILIICCILFSGYLLAQNAPVQFAIYEDHVKPSMDAAYKETLKKLKAACDMHKAGFSWTSAAYDDNSYTHRIPIKGFADLDKNMMADLETKMGKEALGALFAEFDKCIESSSSFIVSMLPNLSYLSPQASQNYRDLLFWQSIPGKDAEAEKIIMEWKTLFESKKAPGGFTTYKVVFGREPGYVIVSWAKDPVDFATIDQKNNQLFGDEGAKLWAKTQAITKKYYHKRGWVLPDHSYSPAASAPH